jgi:hypothetical protein
MPAREPKLTKPQKELLRDCDGGTFCSRGYKPADRLVELGLAQWSREGWLVITGDGRDLLKGN